jgi:protoporphyrinogen/coproporphyrinogen III oxidase
MTSSNSKRAAIVGAGLSGLTATWRLQQAGWQVTVFEASDHAGGRVQTVQRDGYLMDTGASALADSYTSYIALAGELGIGSDIVATAPCVGIYRDGQLHELHLNRPLSLIGTKVLSWMAKLRLIRLILDIALARWRGQMDYADLGRAAPLDIESAGAYARRALGKEVDDYFGSPIARTMLIADPDKISKVELFSGVSNIMSATILALRGGQGRLPQLLAKDVGPRFLHPVQQVVEEAGGANVTYLDPQGMQHFEHFDACVVCCPLPAAVQICPDKRALLEPLHAGIGYTQCITVALAMNHPTNSSAFLVQMPTCEDADIALMFLDHNKSVDRAPAGCGLIDCHWETAAATRMMDRPDDEIVTRSLQTVHRVFPELQGQFAFAHVTRWRQALPLTGVGAYRLIGAFNDAINPRSRIQFAADYMSGAGQNTAVELGNRAAKNLVAHY